MYSLSRSLSRLAIVLTAVVVMLAPRSGQAQTLCSSWDAQMSVDPVTSVESIALNVDWVPAPSACTNLMDPNWPGVDHYRVYKRDGDGDNTGTCTNNTTSFGSSAPAAAEQWRTTSSTNENDFVHRSAKDFRYHVVACADSSCSRKYGDKGNESTSNDEDFDCTETERWVVEDVDDLDPTAWSTGVDWVIDGANASGALFYPAGFTDASSTSISGHLGLWWSHGCGGKTDCVSYKRAGDSGVQSWNKYSNWQDEAQVAEETGGTGDYSDLSHPWVGASDDGTTKSIWLWLRRSVSGDEPDNHLIGIQSEDVQGADFGLKCPTGSTCVVDGDTCAVGDYCDFDDDGADGGTAAIDVCADATADCDYLLGARHGRLMWSYVAFPTFDLDGTDEPWMVFTGSPDAHWDNPDTGWTANCPQVEGDQDDLYRAEWDGTAWSVVVDANGCPVPQSGYDTSGDLHDPGIAPLPGGEFKMYAKRGLTDVYVAYWNDSDQEWEDETPIEIVLDDATATDVTKCVDNIDVVLHAGPPPTELMFFKARPDVDTSGCFDADPVDLGVLYAEHAN